MLCFSILGGDMLAGEKLSNILKLSVFLLHFYFVTVSCNLIMTVEL